MLDEEHLKPKGNLVEQLDKLEHEVGFFRPKLLPRIKELRAEIEALSYDRQVTRTFML